MGADMAQSGEDKAIRPAGSRPHRCEDRPGSSSGPSRVGHHLLEHAGAEAFDPRLQQPESRLR